MEHSILLRQVVFAHHGPGPEADICRETRLGAAGGECVPVNGAQVPN
jgi:hypothetical protein